MTKRTQTALLVGVAGVVLAVLVAFGLRHYSDIRARRSERLAIALSCLGAYSELQAEFRKEPRYRSSDRRMYANRFHGNGFGDLYAVTHADGSSTHLGMIRKPWADAVSPETAYFSYYYVDIFGDARGHFDFTKRCGICAVPVDDTWLPTLIADEGGGVYMKHLRGRSVTMWPDVEQSGWECLIKPLADRLPAIP